MTDAEWAVIEPLLPAPACQSPMGGHPEKHPRRDIVDALRYVTDNGTKWRALPVDFPPWKTVYGFFARWNENGTVDMMRDALRELVRQQAGRHAQPSAAAIDAQSVRAAETVGDPTRGYDAGKKVNGRKRHIAVDTMGLLLVVMVTAANLQDRPAGRPLLSLLQPAQHRVRHVWADGGYTGTLLTWAKTTLGITVEIVTKLAEQTGFVPLHRRWVVERTFSWISQARRNARDYERLPLGPNGAAAIRRTVRPRNTCDDRAPGERCPSLFARLVLQRHSEWVSALSVVAVSGLVLASSAPA